MAQRLDSPRLDRVEVGRPQTHQRRPQHIIFRLQPSLHLNILLLQIMRRKLIHILRRAAQYLRSQVQLTLLYAKLRRLKRDLQQPDTVLGCSAVTALSADEKQERENA